MSALVKTSNINTPLNLVLFKTKEGVNQLGVTTYETVLTFEQLADHFKIEANSDELPEELKMQRDVDASRVRNLKKYWDESTGPIFPDMTIFVSNLDVLNETTIQNRVIIEANLNHNSDRHICDGQGRATLIQWLMNQENGANFKDYTMAAKIVVTHTDNLSVPHAEKIVKQCFSSYHVHLKKPNQSISKHFDSSNAFSNLLNELLEVEVNDVKVKTVIALHGRIKAGHIWTFDQFTSLIQKFLKVTPGTANKYLEKEGKYNQTYNLCSTFLTHLLCALPFKTLDTEGFSKIHDDSMFTKAVFANAMAYVGRSLFDEMLIDETKSWDVLNKIDVPLTDRKDRFWIKHNVTHRDGDSIKIIKGSDKRIASVICRELRIYPCSELSA